MLTEFTTGTKFKYNGKIHEVRAIRIVRYKRDEIALQIAFIRNDGMKGDHYITLTDSVGEEINKFFNSAKICD